MFDVWRFQQQGSEGRISTVCLIAWREKWKPTTRLTMTMVEIKAVTQRFIGKSDDLNEEQHFVLAICSPIMNRAHKYIH